MESKASEKTPRTRKLWRNKTWISKQRPLNWWKRSRRTPALLAQFKENPVKVVESLIVIDLPDDQINQLAQLIKAKIDLDKAGDLLGGLFGKK